MMQVGGSKIARLGILYNMNSSVDLHSLLFAKIIEIATSSYRFVIFLHVSMAEY